MIHLDEVDNVYISEELAGYAKKLVQDGVFPRQVDLLLFGFAYAVDNGLKPPDRIPRHDLVRAGSIERDTRLALEATADWYAKQNGVSIADDEKKLLDFTCRLGSVGVQVLRKEWEGKSKSQIELVVLKLAAARTPV